MLGFVQKLLQGAKKIIHETCLGRTNIQDLCFVELSEKKPRKLWVAIEKGNDINIDDEL